MSEAKAGLKINKLLKEVGWRFLGTPVCVRVRTGRPEGKANVPLKTNVKLKDLGDDFEGVKEGFVDWLFKLLLISFLKGEI